MANSQATLLLYMVAGVLCRRLKIFNDGNQQNFIDLLLNLIMPCMIFNSFRSVTTEILYNTVTVVAVSMGICALSWAAGLVFFRKAPPARRGVLRYATLINNAGFAGMPLAQALFGAEGLIYASVYVIPNRIFMWSAGVTMLSQHKSDWRSVCIKLLENPCILAVFLGLVRGMLQLHLPGFVDAAIEGLGDFSSPLSMMVIGSIIAQVDPRGLFNPLILEYTVLRLVAIPLLVLAGGQLLDLPATVAGTAVTLSAMPAAATTVMLAARYDGDAGFASQLVFVSTVLSLVTAPPLLLLL